MKKIIALGIISFIICTAFNKPAKLTTDYRDAYTGTYFCKSACNVGKINRNMNYISDTLTIRVVKDVTDSVLQVKLGNQVLKVKLLGNNLRAYPSGGYYGGKFFATDSLDIGLSGGRASTCRYLGKKQ
jgi:hypothetical protein